MPQWLGSIPNSPLSEEWASSWVDGLLAGVLALILSSIGIAVSLKLLTRWGVLDYPGERSSHVVPTVRGVGAAIALSWVLAVSWLSTPAWAVVVPIAVFASLGAWDDIRGLMPLPRLILQFSVAVVLATGLIVTTRPTLPTIVAVAVVTVFVVSTVNAVNFMDGINGISACHGVIWGLTYFMILATYTQPFSPWPILAIALAGVMAAFLPINFRTHARAFLGDSGSYMLGAVAASLAVVTWAVTGSWIAALLPLGVYGWDTFLTLVNRLIQGHSPFEAHRQHVYQRVMRSWGSHQSAALIASCATTILCVFAVMFTLGLASGWQVACGAVVVLFAYSIAPIKGAREVNSLS